MNTTLYEVMTDRFFWGWLFGGIGMLVITKFDNWVIEIAIGVVFYVVGSLLHRALVPHERE